ncbi:hypothetical protein HPTD01_3378 [Halomonas sp. TD01]|nr:hypothetical protein GME_11217 [Halomonas sp. TD01]CAH1044900.1 hypothetical protein HPTD01_3378 [Halomonas sp. TD01]
MPVKNICDCDNPPGGQITCEPHQMAVCGVIDGVVRRECVDPPSGPNTPTELANWALTQIVGRWRLGDQTVSTVDLYTLEAGAYRAPNGDSVNFVLPTHLQEAVRELLSTGTGSGAGGVS